MMFLIALAVAAAQTPNAQPNADDESDCCVDPYPVATRIDPHVIVVTATRSTQRAWQTGQAVTVLDASDIDRRQLPVISDLLATTPGLTVTRNGGPGQPTAVRIRGAEDAQTLVVIDGVRVNDPTSPAGAFDFGNLLTGNIERVEVLRGPASVPWGSAAIGGVVNIVTAVPTSDPNADLRGEYGSRDAANIVGRVGGGTGPVSASVGGGYYRDDGVSAFRFGTERDGYRQYAADGRVEARLADNVSLDLRGYYTRSRVGFDGFPPPFFAFADTSDYSKTQQAIGYAGLNADLGGVNNRLAVTLNDIDRDSFGSNPFTARGRVTRFEYQGDARVSDALRLVFGAEHERTRFDDGFAATSTHATSSYAEAIATLSQALTLTGGLRVDDYKTFGTKVTGAANAAFRTGNTVFRIAYGEGFKAPTLFQLYSAFGNTALDPERARSLDIGVEQGFGNGRVGITLFGRNTRDQIDFFSCFGSTAPLCATRPFGYYANIARTRARGAEAFAELRPIEGLTLAANYTYVDAEDRTTGATLLRRPKHSGDLSADWTGGRFTLGATLLLTSRSRDVDFATFAPTMLKGYALAGLRGSVTLGDRFELFARIENLLDDRYETVSGYGTPRREGHVGVRARL